MEKNDLAVGLITLGFLVGMIGCAYAMERRHAPMVACITIMIILSCVSIAIYDGK